MSKKLKFVSLLVAFIFLNSAKLVSASQLPITVFINHVRGDECCDTGSLQTFKNQLDFFKQQNLPAFFALRYDALIDPNFQKVINQYKTNKLFKFGVMLEITPQLAEDSFVQYEGEIEHWYQAQQAFLIGYSREDRQAILDTIIKKYQSILKANPEFSTAWQVDTFSLNYLKETYGLKMHQLAREQWGLDSYTLDGGPPHYPYLASKKWFFVPDFEDKNNLLIVRHTIDDPLYSYGDHTSAFTSQPNDYAIDKKDFGYFEKLLDQTIKQTQQPGYLNLGLENSMSEIFQKEYQKQILKIKEFSEQNKLEVTSDIDKIKNTFSSQPITIHEGKNLITDLPAKVFWITTLKYRLRLRFNKDKTQITDLRIYHPDLVDPYMVNKAQNKGYLIVPYLINAGLNFPSASKPTFIQNLLNIPTLNTFSAEPTKDIPTANNYLELPPVTDFSSIKQPSLNTISYQSENKIITLDFNQSTFDIKQIKSGELKLNLPRFTKYPISANQNNNNGELFWQVEDKKSLKTSWECKESLCHFEFDLNPELFEKMVETQYPFIFPEKITRSLDLEKTVVYVHNRYAIAGRNPVRIVVSPQDKNGFPTSTKNETQVLSAPQADKIKIESQNTSREYQLIDVTQNSPAKINLQLQLDDLTLPSQNIYFAPNCKKEIAYCLTHPRQTWWYIKTVLSDNLRQKLLGENQN